MPQVCLELVSFPWAVCDCWLGVLCAGSGCWWSLGGCGAVLLAASGVLLLLLVVLVGSGLILGLMSGWVMRRSAVQGGNI